MPHATILYAEDNNLVAEAVSDLLEGEGWRVELCLDGNSAMNCIAGGFAYDLLLLDNDLPGVSGIEIMRHARSLPAYRSTPIVMLSAGEHERDARRAGADEFLRKPDGVSRLVEVVCLLLARGRGSA
jgi:two-component system chemotaxis response regulator CheY